MMGSRPWIPVGAALANRHHQTQPHHRKTTAVNDFAFSYSGEQDLHHTGGTSPLLPSRFKEHDSNLSSVRKTAGSQLSPPVFWGPVRLQYLWNVGPLDNRMDRYSWTDDYSTVMGKHQLRFGALLAHNVKNQANNGDFNESPAFWVRAIPA